MFNSNKDILFSFLNINSISLFLKLNLNKLILIKDLKEGMILTGTVRNVTDFGAFVDVGVKHDGLVHISQLSNSFVKNPSDVVSVGDVVKVKIIGIDEDRKKAQLSMKI